MRHSAKASAPVAAIRAFGDILVREKYASSFVINEKTNLYTVVWTKKGQKLNNQISDLQRWCDAVWLGDSPHVPHVPEISSSDMAAAMVEILNGYFED